MPYEEMLFEAAAVLAGTILMGSRISGNRPEAHDSSVTLSSLVQQIAVYRDAFYERLAGRDAGTACRAVAGRGRGGAAALRRRAAAFQPAPGPPPRRAVAARAPGRALCADGLYGGGPAAGPRRAGGLGPAEVRHPLPADHGPPGHRGSAQCRRAERGSRGTPIAGRGWNMPRGCWKNRSACCTARSSAGPWSIPGTSSASAGSTASSPRRRTAFTIIASTS